MVRQMRDQGVKAPLFGADGITADEFASIGGPGVEGTLMTFSPDPRTSPAKQGRVEKFRAKKGSSRKPTRSTAMPRCRSSSRRRSGQVARHQEDRRR